MKLSKSDFSAIMFSQMCCMSSISKVSIFVGIEILAIEGVCKSKEFLIPMSLLLFLSESKILNLNL